MADIPARADKVHETKAPVDAVADDWPEVDHDLTYTEERGDYLNTYEAKGATMTNPTPAPVEAKVKAGAGGSLVGVTVGLTAAFVTTKVYKGETPPAAVTDFLTLAVTSIAGGIGSFVAGYRAKHTPRPAA